MKTKAGVWIDHARAVIVTVTDKGEEVKSITSNVDKQPRRYDGEVSTASREPIPPDDKAQRAYEKHLAEYYDRVIAQIPRVDAVMIFGPGEAKAELKKRIDQEHSALWIAAIETADKMTDRQIAAKVRAHVPTKII